MCLQLERASGMVQAPLSSIASEVLYRGCSVVIAVVEIPTTRIGPAWRNTGRASGWGLCDCFFRFVADDRSI